MPAFVRRALLARGLMGAYRSRPPYQQNDYLGWIHRAKREATKQNRLAKMLAELEGGERYMGMAWRPGLPRQSGSQRSKAGPNIRRSRRSPA